MHVDGWLQTLPQILCCGMLEAKNVSLHIISAIIQTNSARLATVAYLSVTPIHIEPGKLSDLQVPPAVDPLGHSAAVADVAGHARPLHRIQPTRLPIEPAVHRRVRRGAQGRRHETESAPVLLG
eukprot:scaffold174756_cov40-Prasinocladus_malaysianus.AAC.1